MRRVLPVLRAAVTLKVPLSVDTSQPTLMQAALDLGNSDYKVYLVDKSPTVGGMMSRLDKTFPTNDCAM